MNRSVAAIIISGDRFLVARRLEGGEMGGRWEFPGGKVEEGESDEEALAREIDEELGVPCRPVRLLGEAQFVHRGRTRILAAWLGRIPDGCVLELREHTEFRWSVKSEIPALFLADSDRSLLGFLDGIVADAATLGGARDCGAGLVMSSSAKS